MSVPKCKDCEFHKPDSSNGGKERNWCREKSIDPRVSFVLASEAKTSPKWCPKRLEIQKEGEK